MLREKTPSNGPSLCKNEVPPCVEPDPLQGFCPCGSVPAAPVRVGVGSLEKSELSVTLLVVLCEHLYLFCKQTTQNTGEYSGTIFF